MRVREQVKFCDLIQGTCTLSSNWPIDVNEERILIVVLINCGDDGCESEDAVIPSAEALNSGVLYSSISKVETLLKLQVGTAPDRTFGMILQAQAAWRSSGVLMIIDFYILRLEFCGRESNAEVTWAQMRAQMRPSALDSYCESKQRHQGATRELPGIADN